MEISRVDAAKAALEASYGEFCPICKYIVDYILQDAGTPSILEEFHYRVHLIEASSYKLYDKYDEAAAVYRKSFCVKLNRQHLKLQELKKQKGEMAYQMAETQRTAETAARQLQERIQGFWLICQASFEQIMQRVENTQNALRIRVLISVQENYELCTRNKKLDVDNYRLQARLYKTQTELECWIQRADAQRKELSETKTALLAVKKPAAIDVECSQIRIENSLLKRQLCLLQKYKTRSKRGTGSLKIDGRYARRQSSETVAELFHSNYKQSDEVPTGPNSNIGNTGGHIEAKEANTLRKLEAERGKSAQLADENAALKSEREKLYQQICLLNYLIGARFIYNPLE